MSPKKQAMEDTVQNKRQMRRYTAQQRAEFLKQWKESGQSQRVFSSEQGISYTSFNNWIRAETERREQKPGGFVALNIKPDSSGVFAEVRTAKGAVLRLYREVPAQYLREIVRACPNCKGRRA